MARAYQQGKFIPRVPAKYEGDFTDIVYRSSWEFHMMRWCDLNTNVLFWNSEEIAIPYLYDVDGKPHRYFVDFKVTLRLKSGEVKTYLFEVKPEAQTLKPKATRINKKNQEQVFTYIKNQNKWAAAKIYAEQRGWEFKVLTEYDLGIAKRKPR